ncbi:MAG TPA: DUF2330 domain-containing protein [Polyangiaceae bacterium]
MRTRSAFFALAALPVLALVAPRDARACGGCFGPPTETDDVVTDHRMVLSVSPQQTTLYDEIKYSGSPSSFAWVLPISGQVTIGISADAVFDTLDSLSATTVSPPPVTCPGPPEGCAQFAAPSGSADVGGGSSSGGVNVTNAQVVGPYQTVQLQSTDAKALDNWLTTNGYAITADIEPVIAAYVQQGSDFLAMKLVPGAGVQSMRPVRVSFQGASPTLPLRMVAAGTGATVGITLWIVGDGRWEPSNFPWFRIDDSELVWDWSKSDSNYTTLEQQKEAAANNATWEVQASLDENIASVSSQIQSISQYGYYGGSSGGSSGVGGGASGADNYEPIAASGSNPGETADQVEQDDVTALFTGIQNGQFRLTRLRADLARAALANDLQLQAATDQGVLTNVRVAAQSANGPLCPVYQGCSVVGQAVYTPGSSGGGAAFGCTTAAAKVPFDATAAFAAALGLLAVGGVASRRRRR